MPSLLASLRPPGSSIYQELNQAAPDHPVDGDDHEHHDPSDPFTSLSPASRHISLPSPSTIQPSSSPFHDDVSTSRSPPRSPPHRSRRGLAGSHSGATSTIGNRSLMGLLNGTRVEGFGAGFGVGYGDDVLEEEVDEEEQIAMSAGLTIGWVIFFSTFLVGCIDYSRLWKATSLSEAIVPHCVSRFSPLLSLLSLLLVTFFVWRVVRFSLGVRSLWAMHEFYTHLLDIPEDDIQTIPWSALVSRLSELRASHPSAIARRATKANLDAHDVANRIMREENYLIALFNKEVLDLSAPLPGFISNWLGSERRIGGGLTRTLEWNLSFCLLGFLFGADGQVNKAFLSERNRKDLVEALRNRFILMGVINAVFAPFIFVYLLIWSFFRYFEEYHQNPSSAFSRSFTPLAKWQFREFNELPHLFLTRVAAASPLASEYLARFPRAKTALVGRFVAFLAGSFAAVLILFSIIDPDAFLHFEVTKGRTVLFYIGVFGTILAVARGLVPNEYGVNAPGDLMKQIVEHTHYLPEEWKGKLHSAEVNKEFSALYQMKIVVFLQELLSVLITPFVLWYTLPQCAGAIVDFFREFTVHVDGLGYVCSFAVFDFKRHGDPRFGAPVEADAELPLGRHRSNEGKMEKSFLNFTSHNPTWVPRDQTQSLYLSRMTDASVHLHAPTNLHAPGGTGGGARFRGAKDKAKVYERAIQRSMLQSKARMNAGRGDEAIREVSNLDGEGYVATTQTMPFGAREEEDENTEETRTAGGGIQGLLTEIGARGASKGW